MNRLVRTRAALSAAFLVVTALSPAADWPRWRGADQSNASPETGLLQHWPDGGPPLVWRVTGVGLGIHTVSVAGGRVFVVGNRDDGEFLFALDADSGEKIWAARIDTPVPEGRLMRWLTQRSPGVDGDRVYTLSVGGDLVCHRVADGVETWRVRYASAFGVSRPVWGYADHPLIETDRVICAPSGTNAAVAALDKLNGKVLWQCPLPDLGWPGHAALVRAEIGGVPQYVFLHGNGIAGFAAADGRLLWRLALRLNSAGVTYTPIVRGGSILVPDGKGGGLARVRVERGEEGFHAAVVTHRPAMFEYLQDASAVVGDNVLVVERFGIACYDAGTGERRWTTTNPVSRIRSTVTWADGRLYHRDASGRMTLLKVLDDGVEEAGRFPIPEHETTEGVTAPVVAHGRLWLRDNNRLFCYDVTAGAADVERQPRHLGVGLTHRELGSPAREPAAPRTGVHRAPDAVFVPTPQDVVERMLEEAGVTDRDLVVDLGSGDGRVVITAAKRFGSRAIGYEIHPRLVEMSRQAITEHGVGSLARIEHADMFTVDLREATVVTMFLYPHLMERLRPQLERLAPGSRIVSHQFAMPGERPDREIPVRSGEDGQDRRILIWNAPLGRRDGVDPTRDEARAAAPARADSQDGVRRIEDE